MAVWTQLAWGLGLVLVAYALGSLSFAVLISRWLRMADPRTYGSGNPGATNVLRSGNKVAAILTLVADALKGVLPVLAARWAVEQGLLGSGWTAWVGLAAFFGHLYPVFFGFKGGKGVATAAGVLLAFEPMLALAALGSFVIVLLFSRYVSLASMVAAVFAPFYLLFGNAVLWWHPLSSALALFLMAAWLVWRHRENVNRLLKGSESKLGARHRLR